MKPLIRVESLRTGRGAFSSTRNPDVRLLPWGLYEHFSGHLGQISGLEPIPWKLRGKANRCWFTPRGWEKFEVAMRAVAADTAEPMRVVVLNDYDPSLVLYEDEFQVCLAMESL